MGKKLPNFTNYDYFNYFNIRDLAWQILLECKINSLPISLNEILNKYKIKLTNYERSQDILEEIKDTPECGFSILLNKRYVIIINSKISIERQRFTIAHELGHILLKHYKTNMDYDQEEHEANLFAARLLMPMCVLNELHCSTAEQIAKLCVVSHSAAQMRLTRLQMLKTRDKFLTSALEKQVLNNFQDFLNKK